MTNVKYVQIQCMYPDSVEKIADKYLVIWCKTSYFIVFFWGKVFWGNVEALGGSTKNSRSRRIGSSWQFNPPGVHTNIAPQDAPRMIVILDKNMPTKRLKEQCEKYESSVAI